MPKLIDPDDLNQSVEVTFDTTNRTIQLNIAGNLSTDGVTLQCLYSFIKEEWKDDVSLIRFPFPMIAITPEQFEFVNGWSLEDQSSVDLIRDGGFAIKNLDGSSAEEYFGCITLGVIGETDQVYYQQEDGGAAANIILTGVVNQPIKIFGDGLGGGIDNSSAVDFRSYFKIFVREYQKSYAQSELSDIGVNTLTYQAYRFPLSNTNDLKITNDDATISSSLPYTNMSIQYLNGTGFTAWANATVYPANSVVSDSGRWYSTALGGTSNGSGVGDDTGVTDWVSFSGERLIGTNYYPFNVIIDADVNDSGTNPTAEQIYEFVQYSLRQSSDIDVGSDTVIGQTADSLLSFVGDTLNTYNAYIEDFSATDINRIEFIDANDFTRTFPFVAAGTISFSSTLVDDTDTTFIMFFTDANGNNFGDSDAIIVQDNNSNPIQGSVNSNTFTFTFDYDGNAQGGRTPGTDAPITVVAIGSDRAQYVAATGTISRSNENSISLVSALERNYSNP